MELYIIIVLCVIVIILLIVNIVISVKKTSGLNQESSESIRQYLDTTQKNIIDNLGTQNSSMSEMVRQSVELLGKNIESKQQSLSETTSLRLQNMSEDFSGMKKDNKEGISEIRTIVTEKMQTLLNDRLSTMSSTLTSNLAELGRGLREEQKNQLNLISQSMDNLRKENIQSLEKINGTVNEKLQESLDKRISESFKTVSDQLMSVSKGLGEMQGIATNVTDLKKVLSNVKSRGVFGEVQLEAILSEILTQDQYVVQANITGIGDTRVDFAVRLPGNSKDEPVFLPIDAKFPGDTYIGLVDALNSGDKNEADERRKKLRQTIRDEAKSISSKYLAPPKTTDFAIMFLPSEGLYSEVVNMGMLGELQRDFRINIAGPSTMAALLNSLRMGFQTLRIQQKSTEIQKVLEAAKKEFTNFEDVLGGVQKKLKQTEDELGKLVGVRTRAINKALRDITESDSLESAQLLIGDEQ